MMRRQFITLLGGAASTWPLAARAQQPVMPVVGFMHFASPGTQTRFIAAFRRGLSEVGFIEGQNVAVEYRWAEDRADRLQELARDLVDRSVSVIVAAGSIDTALAAKAVTATIPIVFGVLADPVKYGLVQSLARPGGNLTGINYFAAEVVAKRLSLLRELAPKAGRLALLINPAEPAYAETTEHEVKAAAPTLGLEVLIFKVLTSDEVDAAFNALSNARCDVVFVAPSAFFNARRVQLATLATRYAIPAAYSSRDNVEAGGLMSYGTSIADMFRGVGTYAGRMLKGERPSETPVTQATKFEFVINLRTAKALGLEISPTLLARADEVIE